MFEPVLAEILPDILDRVQLRGARRQEDRRDVVGDVELARRVPSGPVEDQNSVGALGDAARDFVEVELHHVGVGIGQHEGRPDAAGRADRAKQRGRCGSAGRQAAWPRSAPGPLPNLAVLLAEGGLVSKPDFDRRRLGQSFKMSLQRAREVFFKAPTVRSSRAG